MNTSFYTSHLETLCDLKIMAEKHNCEIHFGTQSSSSDKFDLDILIGCGVDKRIIDKLDYFDSGVTISDTNCSYNELWFELYDKTNKKYNTMAYHENYCNFALELDYDYDETKSKRLNDFINDKASDYDYSDDKKHFDFGTCPTIITGFGYKTRHKDFRVYREGMALKFFSDLVCKYLGEDSIARTY